MRYCNQGDPYYGFSSYYMWQDLQKLWSKNWRVWKAMFCIPSLIHILWHGTSFVIQSFSFKDRIIKSPDPFIYLSHLLCLLCKLFSLLLFPYYFPFHHPRPDGPLSHHHYPFPLSAQIESKRARSGRHGVHKILSSQNSLLINHGSKRNFTSHQYVC